MTGCRWRVAARLNPSAAGATGRPTGGLRQGKSWSAGKVWRSRAISSPVPVGASSGARCQMTASTAHVEKGHARGGVYTWMVQCGRAPRRRDAGSTPWTMSAARTSTIPEGSTTIPSAGYRGGSGCARRLLLGPCGRLGRRPPGCSRCCARLIQNTAPPHHVAQGGACGLVPHRG